MYHEVFSENLVKVGHTGIAKSGFSHAINVGF